MSERGSEGIHFNESFSKSSILAEKFRKAEVVGEKTQEQNNVANLKVEEILSTSFPIHYQSEEQYNNIPQYKSVIEMVAVSNDSGKTEDVQNRAKNALFEVGLALSQTKEVLKAATEGSGKLNKILPSNLHEIQPYILSVILTDGKDDVQGQELVTDLVELFKMKKKAEVVHGKAQIDYEEKKDSFLDKLYDKSQEIIDEAALGRVETMMGYVLGIDEKKMTEAVKREQKVGNESGKDIKENDVYEQLAELSPELADLYKELIKRETDLGGEDKENNEKRKRHANAANESGKKALNKSESQRSNEREYAPVSVDQIKKLIKEIEESRVESTDLTRNSSKLRILDEVANGNIPITDKLMPEEYEWWKEEIRMRMLANDWFLAASISKTVEDMFKTTVRIHQGDTEHKLDRRFLSHFLRKKEEGENKYAVPTIEAWNLRQRANFEYITKAKNGIAVEGYLVNLWQKYGAEIEKGGDGFKQQMSREEFLEAKPAMKANKDFGIKKDYYTTYRCDQGSARGEIVKMCMVKEIAKDKTIEKMADAERAVELAKRISVITYQDSVANIGFVDADDYAEILLFKFIRYQDGSEAPAEENDIEKQKDAAKNKAVGYYESIKYINFLSPSWLETLCFRDGNKTKEGGVYSALKANEIDFDKIGGSNEMSFHLGSILFKKVLPARELLMKAKTPKDFENFQDLQRAYDQLNKTMTEAAKYGFDLLDLEANGIDKNTPLYEKMKLFRMWYPASVLGMAETSNGLGWTRDTINDLRRLVVDPKFIGKDGKFSASFMDKEQWEWIMKDVMRDEKYIYNGLGLYRKLVMIEDRKRRDARSLLGK